MRRRRWGAALALLLLASCARGKPHEDGTGKSLLKPTFAPDREGAALGDGSGASTSTSTPTASRSGSKSSSTTVTTLQASASANEIVVAIGDRVGDLTPSPLDPPPPWADLAGAKLTRTPSGFELRVTLGGGTAPTTTDEDHTMNVASFYDVDGDGTVDYEVWANLASGGWGSSWFDNDGRRGAFQERSGVTVTVEGGDVVMRFPATHLGGFERFRWSVASEWGRYEVLGTAATARDDAPDNDGAARFPG
jgi:hypothetical protein